MKKVLSLILLVLISLSYWFQVSASSLFEDKNKVLYCADSSDCNIDKWTEVVKNWINWLETTVNFSQFVQNIVMFLLTFISIIAVVYIIYAWFNILISRWSEDVHKKQKSTIFSIVIWIVLIWMSYTIVTFIINLANQWWTK